MKTKLNYYGIDQFSKHHYICSSLVEIKSSDCKPLTNQIIKFAFSIPELGRSSEKVKNHIKNRVYFKEPISVFHSDIKFTCVYVSRKD